MPMKRHEKKTFIIQTLVRKVLLAEAKLQHTPKENSALLSVLNSIDDLLTRRANSKAFKNAFYDLNHHARLCEKIATSDELLNS